MADVSGSAFKCSKITNSNRALHSNQPGIDIKRLQRNLLRWYQRHLRALPWRDKPTPYRVWISEIMLQQTQVKTVIPYYDRFLKRFPDVEALANASEEDVLALWSGLGYYNRARNLCKAAKRIVSEHGEFPADFESVLALPGIGRYTAGAICSIAFNQPYPVVDGNIQRVISRLKALRVRPPAGYFWRLMEKWLPERAPSAFNQAMMELGATVCLPSQPRCPGCPLKSLCEAQALGIQTAIPCARGRQADRRISIVVVIIERDGKILLTSRHKLSIIPGKWGLPCRQIDKDDSSEHIASELGRIVAGRKIPLIPFDGIRHSISNYRIRTFGYFGELNIVPLSLPPSEAIWMETTQEKNLLISSLYRKMLKRRPGAGSVPSK